ncbi:MAG: hydrogenase maturation factor [Blautia sp.]|nr:hydrogenase maturation factor [Blautia sp.]
MRPGPKVLMALQEEVQGRLLAGCDLVVAGTVGDAGVCAVIEERQEVLRRFFSPGFLRGASLLRENGEREDLRKRAEAALLTAREKGSLCTLPLGEGGFLAGLWKVSLASELGCEVDLRKVPIRQETIEICEIFNLDPYGLFSEGSILCGTQRGAELCSALRRKGIASMVIGNAKAGNDKLLFSASIRRYLDRPGPDELEKIRNQAGMV